MREGEAQHEAIEISCGITNPSLYFNRKWWSLLSIWHNSCLQAAIVRHTVLELGLGETHARIV